MIRVQSIPQGLPNCVQNHLAEPFYSTPQAIPSTNRVRKRAGWDREVLDLLVELLLDLLELRQCCLLGNSKCKEDIKLKQCNLHFKLNMTIYKMRASTTHLYNTQ